jgi:membrane-associated phospholipid phosphatase
MRSLLDAVVSLDRTALEGVQALRWAPLTALFVLASAWWVKGLAILGIGAISDLRARRLPVAVAAGAIALGVASLAATLLKDLVDRARPAVADPAIEALVVTPGSASFPSSHAAVAFATATAVGMLCPRIRWPLIALAGVVALSRVYLGVHFWLDIAVGAALGAGLGWLAARAVRAAALRLAPQRVAAAPPVYGPVAGPPGSRRQE